LRSRPYSPTGPLVPCQRSRQLLSLRHCHLPPRHLIQPLRCPTSPGRTRTLPSTLEVKGFQVDAMAVDGGGDQGTVLATDPPVGTQAQPGSRGHVAGVEGQSNQRGTRRPRPDGQPGQADPEAGRVHQTSAHKQSTPTVNSQAESWTRALRQAIPPITTSRSRYLSQDRGLASTASPPFGNAQQRKINEPARGPFAPSHKCSGSGCVGRSS
jgi:hypothetical protein